MLLLGDPIDLKQRRHLFVKGANGRYTDPVLQQSGGLQQHIIVRQEHRRFATPFQPGVLAARHTGRTCREKQSPPERLGHMPIVIGADIHPAGGKLSSQPDGSLNPLLSSELAPSREVLVDALPDQVSDRSPRRRRGMPKSFELAIRQLNLCSNHANHVSWESGVSVPRAPAPVPPPSRSIGSDHAETALEIRLETKRSRADVPGAILVLGSYQVIHAAPVHLAIDGTRVRSNQRR